jgi:hypothetical protein
MFFGFSKANLLFVMNLIAEITNFLFDASILTVKINKLVDLNSNDFE